jgi:hypothetical protein
VGFASPRRSRRRKREIEFNGVLNVESAWWVVVSHSAARDLFYISNLLCRN